MFVETIPRTERRKITIRHELDYKMGYTYIHTHKILIDQSYYLRADEINYSAYLYLFYLDP